MPEIKFESDWLKANVNVQEGDVIRFLDAGHQDEQKAWVFLVGIIPQGFSAITAQKKFSLNKKNFNSVSKLYGTNSDNWVKKDMQVKVVSVENPKTGDLVDAIRLVAVGGIPAEEVSEFLSK